MLRSNLLMMQLAKEVDVAVDLTDATGEGSLRCEFVLRYNQPMQLAKEALLRYNQPMQLAKEACVAVQPTDATGEGSLCCGITYRWCNWRRMFRYN